MDLILGQAGTVSSAIYPLSDCEEKQQPPYAFKKNIGKKRIQRIFERTIEDINQRNRAFDFVLLTFLAHAFLPLFCVVVASQG